MASVKIPSRNVAEWCGALDAILLDKTLTPQDRAEVEGTKKAMARLGFKRRESKIEGTANGA